MADRGRDDNIFGGDDNNLGQGKDRATLIDGAKDADVNVGGNGSLVDDIDEMGKNTETPLPDGTKNQGGNAGADGSAEAVADGGRDNKVFEGDDNDLGQGEDRATLTDGAKDADA